MIRPSIPTTRVEDVITVCSCNIQDNQRKKNFETSVHDIAAYSIECLRHVRNREIASIDKSLSARISSGDMLWLYENKLRRRGQPGRKYYDEVLVSTPNNMCLYCGCSVAASLDHYLSKSEYSYLSVTLQNLIPVCLSCNQRKGSETIQNGSPILNPYFDYEKLKSNWLRATVAIENDTPFVTYVTSNLDEYDSITAGRIREHFSRLKLGQLYATIGANEMSSIPSTLVTLRKRLEKLDMGFESLLKEFETRRDIYIDDGQTPVWKVALYNELAQNNDFARWAWNRAQRKTG